MDRGDQAFEGVFEFDGRELGHSSRAPCPPPPGNDAIALGKFPGGLSHFERRFWFSGQPLSGSRNRRGPRMSRVRDYVPRGRNLL